MTMRQLEDKNERKQEQQNQRYILQQRCKRALCCSCRLSVSSETESASSERFASVSTLAHAMVQQRLDQMINQTQKPDDPYQASRASTTRRHRTAKFVVLMVAMEKCTDDPREDFRASMVEMITANRIEDPRDLRRLLNYYVSVNSDDCREVILEAFHEVCSSLFSSSSYSCKSRYC